MVKRSQHFAFSLIKHAKLTMSLQVESCWTAVSVLTMALDSCLQQVTNIMLIPQTSVLTSPIVGKGNGLFGAGAW